MPRVKGYINKSDVKDFLNDKYSESKAAKSRRIILEEIAKTKAYVDNCPHCGILFEVPPSDVKIHDDSNGIYGTFKCPNCHTDLIYQFKTKDNVDPLFGGNISVIGILKEAKDDKHEI